MDPKLNHAIVSLLMGEATPDEQRMAYRELVRLQAKVYALEKQAGVPDPETDYFGGSGQGGTG